MILLLIALLLLPSTLIPRKEFYPVEKVEVKARDGSFPPDARRAIVVTRTGGASPVKVLNVKAYEKETEYNTARVEYIVVYHSRDYVMAQRQVDFESFEKLWLELNKNRALTLTNATEGDKSKPTYTVRVKEVKRENSFNVVGAEGLDDKRYYNIISALETFWRENLEIQ